MRCAILVEPLELLKKESKNIIKYSNAIKQLDLVLQKCLEYVEKMSKSSWQRICLNLAYTLSISKEYDDLNKELSTVSADLNFSISIDQNLIDQAKANDDAKTMQTIFELLEVNGQMTTDIKSSVELQNNLLFDKLVKFESMFNDLFERTNTLLEIVNNDETINSNNNNKGNIMNKIDHNKSKFDLNNLNELNLTQLEWNETYLNSRGSINGPNNNNDDNDIETKGIGSFGSVFACNYYGIKVALKHFNNFSNNYMINKTDLLKMKREALIMQNCVHRNIVSFIGCSIEKGLIAMELATCSLSDILYTNNGNNNRLSFRNIVSTINSIEYSSSLSLKIFNDISRALRYLHYHKIIHRDIKSSNILLFITGTNIQAKVGDFGLAYTMGMTIQNSTTNNDNIKNNKEKAVGTIAYMAPELLDFDGDKPLYTNSVDIYGFGIIMNEVLTKQQPWYGLRDPQIISKVIVKKHRPDLYISKNIHESKLVELIGNSDKGCLAHNNSLRPTASYLTTALETIISTYLPQNTNELENDTKIILANTITKKPEKPIKPSKIPIINDIVTTNNTSIIKTDIVEENSSNSSIILNNNLSKVYYHSGNYSFWKVDQCWDCCLATNPKVQGCQQNNEIKHHVRRYTQDHILVNLGFGKWLCCNEKKRNSIGCQNGEMPPLFHPGN